MAGLARIRQQLAGPLHAAPLLVGPSRKGFLGKITGECDGRLTVFPGIYTEKVHVTGFGTFRRACRGQRQGHCFSSGSSAMCCKRR